MPHKLACNPALPPKVRQLALDAIQKLIAHGLLNGGSEVTSLPSLDIPPTTIALSESSNIITTAKIGLNESKDKDDPHTPIQLAEEIQNSEPIYLIEEIVSTIAGCFAFLPTEDAVQLQVLKVYLTLVSCNHCQVHHSSLLK